MMDVTTIDRERSGNREILGGGALSGVIAGIVMAIVAIVYAAITGMEPFLPVKLIAAVLFGVSALIGDAGVVVAGVVVHLVVSAVFGIVFAVAVPKWTGSGRALLGGLVYGVLIWAIMTWLILPIVNPVMAERIALIPVAWFCQHLVFGAVLAVTPALERATGRTARPLRREEEEPILLS